MTNILQLIHENLGTFSKSERKVAEAIMASPQTTIHSSIAVLAKVAKVSEPTVNRFCHRLNTKGFPDFKLHLAQSLANGTPYVHRHVDEMDGAGAYTAKIFESTMAYLEDAKKGIDPLVINRAVEVLTQADKISFFGLGASSSVAHDALNKFLRFNIPVNCFDDIVMQKINCINSKDGDVMVLISHTGRTKTLVEVAELARENNAFVIAITTSGSPLAAQSHLVLPTGGQEDTDMYMPTASRIAQLVLIDVLATGFTLRRGPAFRDNLKRVKAEVKDSRFDKLHTPDTHSLIS